MEWTSVYKKKEDKNAKENYKPVNVLSCVNKVFERLLRNHVATKYDNHLSDCLTAYRKHNSCETTLIGQVQDLKPARENRLLVGILSTDVSKVFEGLHPQLMLHKLRANFFYHRVGGGT